MAGQFNGEHFAEEASWNKEEHQDPALPLCHIPEGTGYHKEQEVDGTLHMFEDRFDLMLGGAGKVNQDEADNKADDERGQAQIAGHTRCEAN